MPTHPLNDPTPIPADKITRCKPSRRGMRARAMQLTARPKPQTISWAAAEAFAPVHARKGEPAPIEARLPVGEA